MTTVTFFKPYGIESIEQQTQSFSKAVQVGKDAFEAHFSRSIRSYHIYGYLANGDRFEYRTGIDVFPYEMNFKEAEVYIRDLQLRLFRYTSLYQGSQKSKTNVIATFVEVVKCLQETCKRLEKEIEELQTERDSLREEILEGEEQQQQQQEATEG